MKRDDLPGEEEQYAVFSALVRGMDGKPVTVRTFDLGGDKIARSLSGHNVEPTNPALPPSCSAWACAAYQLVKRSISRRPISSPPVLAPSNLGSSWRSAS